MVQSAIKHLPPGYQSREAVRVKAQRPTGNVAGAGRLGIGVRYEQLQEVNNHRTALVLAIRR